MPVDIESAETEADLLAMATEADSGREIPEVVTPAADKQPSTEKQDQLPDDPSKSPGTEVEKAKVPEPVKPLSPYEKAKAEKSAREARSWKEIEDRKAQLAQERAAFEAERQKIADETKKAEAEKPFRDDKGYTAEEYERAAAQWQKDGELDLASAAIATAQKLRQQQSQAQQTNFQAEVTKSFKDFVAKRPEFADASSPAGKEVGEVLKEFPILWQVPNGFAAAVGIMESRKTAASVPGLNTKITELTKEIERLKGLTSLPESNPTGAPPKAKSIEEMDDAEAERHCRALAREADSWAAA